MLTKCWITVEIFIVRRLQDACMWPKPKLPVEKTAQGPVAINEEVDGCIEEHHRHRVIEKSQHKYGVDPVRSAAHKD